MPKRCKDLFEISLSGEANVNEEWSEEEKEFLIDLACQLKMDAEMMTVAYNMSQEEMTQNISAEYVALLEKAAEADGHYDSVEKSIIDQIKNWKLSKN